MKKRIAALICVIALAFCQAYFVVPASVSASSAGEVLTVRVQYAGEREDKIREKASFTSSELEAMGAGTYRYTNVTNVGTVLQIVAYGPRVSDIITAAGIDLNSVKTITFRTTDGGGAEGHYSHSFTVGGHLTSTRYYYPNLPKNYERDADAEVLTPLPGSLEGAQTVPAILALKSDSTKNPTRTPKEGDMDTDECFRFCLGQPALVEGSPTVPSYEGGDVSAMESAQFIYGMDITLYGSPVKGISLELDEKIKVGSKKKITAVIEGDELFEDSYGFTTDDLTWESSDTSIAEVDQDGTITVKKEGQFTITATAPNGMTASITINATADAEDKEIEPVTPGTEGEDTQGGDGDGKETGKSKETKKVKGIVVKEVSLTEMIDEDATMDDAKREQMANDAEALDAAEEANPVTVALSGYTAAVVFGLGAVWRGLRFYREV